jgi:hypothetical protein
MPVKRLILILFGLFLYSHSAICQPGIKVVGKYVRDLFVKIFTKEEGKIATGTVDNALRAVEGKMSPSLKLAQVTSVGNFLQKTEFSIEHKIQIRLADTYNKMSYERIDGKISQVTKDALNRMQIQVRNETAQEIYNQLNRRIIKDLNSTILKTGEGRMSSSKFYLLSNELKPLDGNNLFKIITAQEIRSTYIRTGSVVILDGPISDQIAMALSNAGIHFVYRLSAFLDPRMLLECSNRYYVISSLTTAGARQLFRGQNIEKVINITRKISLNKDIKIIENATQLTAELGALPFNVKPVIVCNDARNSFVSSVMGSGNNLTGTVISCRTYGLNNGVQSTLDLDYEMMMEALTWCSWKFGTRRHNHLDFMEAMGARYNVILNERSKMPVNVIVFVGRNAAVPITAALAVKTKKSPQRKNR